MSKKKWIEIKKGNKTTYKLVDENYVEEEKFVSKDISNNNGFLPIGLTDEEYNRIFKKESEEKWEELNLNYDYNLKIWK